MVEENNKTQDVVVSEYKHTIDNQSGVSVNWFMEHRFKPTLGSHCMYESYIRGGCVQVCQLCRM